MNRYLGNSRRIPTPSPVLSYDPVLLAKLRRRVREDDGTRYPLGDVLRQIAEETNDD